MTRRTAKDFHPEVLSLFDQLVHGDITRRDFLSRAGQWAVAGVSASALLHALSPNFAQAKQINERDARIKTQYVEYPSPKGSGQLRAYMAAPANSNQKLPTVLVVHENRGLNPHIEDIARRLAVDGFIALAPDALYSLGGYPNDEDQARELFTKLDQTKVREDFVTAAEVLKHLPAGNGRVGVVGFCYGGAMANFLATRLPELAAAVAFYGGQPTASEAAAIKARLQLHFAGNDARVNAGWPAYEIALKAANVDYQAFNYAGVEHGFNNDTTPRYDEAAATLAWARTMAFFKERLASDCSHEGR